MPEKRFEDNHSKGGAFFALVRAGLWEKEVQLLPFREVSFATVLRVADEQSVVGLVAAGIDHIIDMRPAKQDALQFVGRTVLLEQRNQAMNLFIGGIVSKMRRASIYTLLVKGQGIAQCYEKPLWRSSGDIDFFLNKDNYDNAKVYLVPLASSIESEDVRKQHQAMTIDSWDVELHGRMHTEISERINRVIDKVQNDIFSNGKVRSWDVDGVTVFLPSADNDAILVFTHFLQHFFVGGVGLRQICDWCRLLWTFRDSLDKGLLEKRLQEMGIVSEWKAFGAFAVEWLGMPVEAMPLYSPDAMWRRKARRICRVIMDAGNFGHNKDNSYRTKYPLLVEKSITFFRRIGEYARLFCIFPGDAPRFFATYVSRRVNALKSK